MYSKEANLSLTVIGLILMGMRILDAVIDPLIGYASDRARSRFGRRKPFIVAGSLLATAGAFVAFNPTAQSGYLHFAIGYFLLVTGWSLAEIPHQAWINEVSHDYDQRSRLATFRFIAYTVGRALFLAIPLTGFFATTEMTPEVMGVAAWLAAAFFLLTLPLLLVRVPDVPAAEVPGPGMSVVKVLKSVSGNAPFWHFVGMRACAGLASGIVQGLFFFYLASYLRIGAMYSHIMLVVQAITIVGALFWLRATVRLDKHHVIAICALSIAMCNVAMYFIEPGASATAMMIGIFGLTAFTAAGIESMRHALMADVADYGRLRSGQDHSGNYFAASLFIEKCFEAVGGGLGLVIAGLFGFTLKGPNDAMALAGFFVAIVWMPAALNLSATAIAWRFPITRRRQIAIRHRLERRDRAAEAIP